MKKQLFLFLLMLLPMVANADDSGSCGDNVTYTYVESTHTLTISGSGAMANTWDNYAPWYSYRSEITKVVIEDGVTSIGDGAFLFCSGLTSVIIPNSVTSIGDGAFYGCSGLISVTIPNSVTSIGFAAFYECSGLTSVTIPNSVTSIGDYAFSGCSGLTSVNIPNGVTSIGEGAFYGCSGLTSVNIPNSVTSIGYATFSGCSGLTSVTIPNSVTSIGDDAFRSCSGLTSVTIPNSVTSIGSYAFYDCSSLTSVSIPNSVTSIGSYAFYDCSGLTSVTIPNSVTSIGDGAFSGCSGLISVTIPNSVTSIGIAAFYECSGIKTVRLGNKVTSIGSNAFSGCTALKDFYCITSSAPSIGSYCFSNTPINNATLHVPYSSFSYYKSNYPWSNFGSVVKDGTLIDGVYYYLFMDDDNLCAKVAPSPDKYSGNITIPSSVTYDNKSYSVVSIGEKAFYDCTYLTKVTIPSSVTSISDDAFYNTGIASIIIPGSVTGIGKSAFRDCSSLTSVTIGNGVTSIDSWAFRDCSSLTSVHITDLAAWCKISFGCSDSNPLFYAHHLFLNGTEIKDLVIPESVKSIGGLAFHYCSGITSVTIPNGVTSIGDGAFWACSGLNSVTIGNGVTSISDYAFYCCYGLTSVTIGNGVTSIGNNAFYYCNKLTSVNIPNSVTSIGNSAFYNCNTLNSVVISDLEAWCNISFDGAYSNPLYYAHHLYLNDAEIKNLVIPESVTQINPLTFQEGRGFTSLTIPNHITIIPENAFQGCSGLTSITLPNQLSIIRANAFSGCSSLESLTIPASVEYIYQSAFANCSSLTSINAQSTTPPFLYDNSFSDFSVPVNVPNGCAETYRAAQGWSNFTTINDGNVYYQLSVTADNHGTVTYNSTAVKNTTKTFDVMEATNATLTLTPDEGYKVKTVTVNGTDKTADVVNGTLTINNVTANMTVNVTFGIAGETETVTIGAEEMATFCSSKDLDFSEVEGLKAYTATGYDHGTLTVTRVLNAPAGTGLLLKGEAGSYEVPYATTTGYYTNLLRGVTEETWVSPTEGNQTNFLLGNKSGVTSFYRLSAAGTLAGGKAYLQLPTSVVGEGSNSRIMRIVAEDETTGMSEVLMDNGQWTNGDDVYDLQGRRVAKPSKGLYIVNGRKVVVK